MRSMSPAYRVVETHHSDATHIVGGNTCVPCCVRTASLRRDAVNGDASGPRHMGNSDYNPGRASLFYHINAGAGLANLPRHRRATRDTMGHSMDLYLGHSQMENDIVAILVRGKKSPQKKRRQMEDDLKQ